MSEDYDGRQVVGLDLHRSRTVMVRTTAQVTLRTPGEIAAFFAGFDLVEPGLVDLPAWCPDGPIADLGPGARVLAGMGRKR